MSLILTVILTICALQIIGIMIFNALHRRHLSNMHGMITSMTLGMLGGILFGAVIGILFNGDLFTATFVSILIGLSIGFIAGLPFNLLAVIDGSVSGLMGGMMGAMLGEMIPLSNPDSAIKLLAFFTMMLLLMITYLTEESVRNHKVLSVRTHPFFYTIMIVLLFFLIKDIPIITIEVHHNHRFLR
ncbi:hypothetical protein [Ornithinibacillus sp. 179-J 7C1 HS]|uniref:hypothetical protein n=1 Tax=Ornithinibacillus sp. 179-J 7C1 HS TaxID=3142384 RepID=UPI0039A106EE